MFYTDFILRIVLSLTLGFLIGLERQLTGHPAGIPCRKQYYIWCWLFMQWCYLQG